MDLDLRLVRYFVAVADELHFGRAAAKLYISQPALSKQIRRLEEQVGAQLLVRDTRHVTLTARGQQFLAEARRLLAIARTMQQPARANTVRMAHVFELDTSREVADAYAARFPDVALTEHALDSATQLEALLQYRLDVAILRITPRMLVEHPAGWEHRLLRLEPLVLVGGDADGKSGPGTASLHDGPLDVFGDPPESGSYNAHGDFLSAAERDLGLELRWLGTPGAFSHCLARVTRSAGRNRFLEFHSYASRYAEHGFALRWPREAQPYYPWSLAWRSEPPTSALAEFLRVARAESAGQGWLHPAPAAAGPPWLPPDDPVRREDGFAGGR
ncbi:LysR family transcriptional regulator [Nakamurella sp.]|uniref:LysR family transcriptional regulator n=1 Tax=Nakamurella sp. TaxID=1869182 RepID=UPI003783B13C